MACETAVVASAVGGIPEVVVDGETGYLVPYDPAQADDPAAVAEFEAGLAEQDQPADRRPGAGQPLRQGRAAALHRRVQLGQDRRRDRRGLPPSDRGPPVLSRPHRRALRAAAACSFGNEERIRSSLLAAPGRPRARRARKGRCMARYRDRTDAGRVLAAAIPEAGPFVRPVVLALPRGGVPVAVEVAAALGGAARGDRGAQDRRARPARAGHRGAGPGRDAGLHLPQPDDGGRGRGRRRRVRPRGGPGADRARAPGSGVPHAGRSAAGRRGRGAGRRRAGHRVDHAARRSPRSAGASRPGSSWPCRSPRPPPCTSCARSPIDVVCPRVPANFVAVGLAYADFAQLTDQDVQEVLAG